LCLLNLNNDNTLKNLSDEPGIPELMQLYLDDKYDYSNGSFIGMSEKTKQQFMKDLKIFYTAFTGNENMPPEITRFSDIKLKDYNRERGCQGDKPIFKNNYKISKSNKLFIEYAQNISNMISSAASKQSELLSIINDIFTYVIDPYTNKRKIRINPKLTEEILQKDIEKARRIIIELYVKCEQDYVNGIKIYEAIVESKILETTQQQIKKLEKEAVNLINSSNTSTPAAPKAVPAPIPAPESIAAPKAVPAPIPAPESIAASKVVEAPAQIPAPLPKTTEVPAQIPGPKAAQML
jgi:hypothetical protein